MDVWNINRIADRLEELDIAIDREAMSLARWIWEDILTCTRDRERKLEVSKSLQLDQTFERLLAGEPIQYIAGHAWFYGMKFTVSRDVLIPRPETEELVEWILSDGAERKTPLRILDIGTGSGCIAIALKKKMGPQAVVTAVDIDEGALAMASENAELLETEITFIRRDFLQEGFAGLGIFDIIVSNPPYVSSDQAGRDIVHRLRYEPSMALYPEGNDPDVFYKKINREAGRHLAAGGACYLELNEFRAIEIQKDFRESGWQTVEVRIDMQGLPRMMKVEKK